mmetsp:Transcript_3142/g.9017  ORF Transcript_3142/g.9017 Transcript_3142/m.9017 type:complete len:257 (-) Transcript_3142:106-876(-)
MLGDLLRLDWRLQRLRRPAHRRQRALAAEEHGRLGRAAPPRRRGGVAAQAPVQGALVRGVGCGHQSHLDLLVQLLELSLQGLREVPHAVESLLAVTADLLPEIADHPIGRGMVVLALMHLLHQTRDQLVRLLQPGQHRLPPAVRLVLRATQVSVCVTGGRRCSGARAGEPLDGAEPAVHPRLQLGDPRRPPRLQRREELGHVELRHHQRVRAPLAARDLLGVADVPRGGLGRREGRDREAALGHRRAELGGLQLLP